MRDSGLFAAFVPAWGIGPSEVGRPSAGGSARSRQTLDCREPDAAQDFRAPHKTRGDPGLGTESPAETAIGYF
jgi:hypothetical protein